MAGKNASGNKTDEKPTAELKGKTRRAESDETAAVSPQSSAVPEIEPEGPTHEEIARRAYQCWEKRAGGEGCSEDDWYQAEQELRAERARTGVKAKSSAAASAS